MWHPLPPARIPTSYVCEGEGSGDATGAVTQLGNRFKVKRGRGRVRAAPPPYPHTSSPPPIWIWPATSFQPVWRAVTKRAGLVIFSILNHWYQRMSGKGRRASAVIHVQDELAARICVIAVAWAPTPSSCTPPPPNLLHLRGCPRGRSHGGSPSRSLTAPASAPPLFLC